jgi:hypothetical protein
VHGPSVHSYFNAADKDPLEKLDTTLLLIPSIYMPLISEEVCSDDHHPRSSLLRLSGGSSVRKVTNRFIELTTALAEKYPQHELLQDIGTVERLEAPLVAETDKERSEFINYCLADFHKQSELLKTVLKEIVGHGIRV